jgi:hypothetical protein
MDEKEKQTLTEASAWETFEAAMLAIPRDQLEEPLLADGWSVKDVLMHITRWWEDCAATLESIHTTYVEWDGDTDAENEKVREQGKTLSLEDVELRSAHVRERMLLAWDAAPADDPRAKEAFDSETTEHYDEHLDQVRSLAR